MKKDRKMKKIAIFFLIIIIIIVGISYMYLNYKVKYNEAQKANMEFESYYDQNIMGTDLTTVINKAVDNNKINEVKQDNKGRYINNDENSINIDIKMLKFVQYYGTIQFKCTKIDYHKTTNKVKYMLFEQITQ